MSKIKNLLKKKLLLSAVVLTVFGGGTLFAMQQNPVEPQKTGTQEDVIELSTSVQEKEEPTANVPQEEPQAAPQQTQPQPEPQTEPTCNVGGQSPFTGGRPAQYVFNKRQELGKPLFAPEQAKTEAEYFAFLKDCGAQIVTAPSVGDVLYDSVTEVFAGQPGHMAIVEKINPDGSIWITQMGPKGQRSMTDKRPDGGLYRINWKLIPSGEVANHQYVR